MATSKDHDILLRVDSELAWLKWERRTLYAAIGGVLIWISPLVREFHADYDNTKSTLSATRTELHRVAQVQEQLIENRDSINSKATADHRACHTWP